MRFEEIRAKFPGSGPMAKCPAHDDGNASLSITQGDDGKTLVHCHAGCTTGAICVAAGLTLADLFDKPAPRNGFNIVAEYDYRDETGSLLFQVCRMQPKDFRQRRPDPRAPGGWTWKTAGVRRVPFRLPELLAAVADGKPVFVCEGEKDVLALVKAGFAATCNPGGAGKWLPEFASFFNGSLVCIIADKDAPGRNHAESVAANLHPVAASVRVLELPDIGGKPVKDSADFFTAGGQADQLVTTAEDAPLWTAPSRAQIVPAATDIRGEILATLTDGRLSPTEQRTQIAASVVAALAARGQFFFHAERRDFESAMFFDHQRKRLERIRSDAFIAWLSEWLRVNRADTLFRFIVAQVETAALSGSQTQGIIPESFWASRPGAIYVSTGDGQAAKITPGQVQLVDNGTDGILFAAGRTLAPWTLTSPADPFETCSLFSGANYAATHGRDLLRLWVLSLPTAPASKPPLCNTGNVGSGKTRLAKGIAELYGLPFLAHKVEDAGEDDFWVSLDAGGVFTMDNADTRNKWLADAVANAATDGCSQRRKLYSNSETVTLRARAWLCITTANPSFASDAGLADRLLVVRLNRRTDETSDARLSDEIRQNRDAALSFIAHTLATALADIQPTPGGINYRHPDFAAFAVRTGRAIGREADAVAALRQAEQDKSLFCLENDAVGAALLAHLGQSGQFTGTSAELRQRLIETDGDLAEKLSAKRLGKRLTALWPHLEKILATAKHEKDRKGFTVFTLEANSAEFAEFQTVF